jgi:hypothetical protein
MDGDAHHANEAGDRRKRQDFAGEQDHVNNSQTDAAGCRCGFVLIHDLFHRQSVFSPDERLNQN